MIPILFNFITLVWRVNKTTRRGETNVTLRVPLVLRPVSSVLLLSVVNILYVLEIIF